MENKFIYHQWSTVYLTYEYWWFGFKRKKKVVLVRLPWPQEDDLFGEYPEGHESMLDYLVEHYRKAYNCG